MLRDSLLQLVNKRADGMHSVAGIGKCLKTCQTDDNGLLMRKLEGVGKRVEKDQRADMSLVHQEDPESLVPRWMSANVGTSDSEAHGAVKTSTRKWHVSRTTRIAENERTSGGLDSSISSLSEQDSTNRPPIARLIENEPMETKTHRIQNDIRTAEEQKRIHEALHPPPLSLLPDKANTSTHNDIIAANIAFNSATSKYSSPQKTAYKKIMACNNDIDESGSTTTIDDSQITAILQRLGIDNDILLDRSKKCRLLLAQLRHDIDLDLVSVDNEERETMMRMAGYWRYVNRRTYNAMVRNNQLWDWATGAKLEELEVTDHETEDGNEDAQAAVSQENADVVSSLRSKSCHRDKSCDTPATRINEKNVIKRVIRTSGKKDESVSDVGSPHKGILNQTGHSSSDSSSQGNDPRSRWAGIRDTRHLPETPHKTPPETPLAHPAAVKHATRPHDNNPIKPLSLRFCSTSSPSSMRKPKARQALSAIDRPRTSLKGTASYADMLKKGLL